MSSVGRVRVLYFAGARDAAGKQSELLEIDGQPTVEGVLGQLVSLHPALRALTRSLRLSVNQEVVEAGTRVKDGDEVGVLPPVAGG